jgi:hypothetical protein
MTLSTEQQQRLVKLIRSDHGFNVSKSQFIETVFNSLENISGFEQPETSINSELINNLWRTYRAKSKQRHNHTSRSNQLN